MDVFFLDTSAAIKRYVQETGMAWVQAITAPTTGNILFLARITLPETVAAITRRERGRHIAPADAATALTDFTYDFAHQYRVVDITAILLDEAARLARTYALRGYDAVQLAAVLSVRSQIPTVTLVSADAELNAAAIAESLIVEDPNMHP